MATKANKMVLKKIESLNVDDNVKRAMEDIMAIEFEYGNNPKRKKQKISRVQEMVARRMMN